MGKRYWEDLVEGERFTCRPVAFDRDAMIAFGKEYDPWPFHVDMEAAGRSIFGGVTGEALRMGRQGRARTVLSRHGMGGGGPR